MKFVLAAIMIFVCSLLDAQNPLLLDFHPRLNATHLNIDSLENLSAYLPGIHILRAGSLSDNLHYEWGGGVDFAGSNSFNPYYKHRFSYLTGNFTLTSNRQKILSALTGIEASYLLASRLFLSSDESKKMDFKESQYRLEFKAGLMLNLQQNLYLSLSGYFPLYSPFKHLAFGLHYYFTPEEWNRKTSEKKKKAYQQITELKNGILFIRLPSQNRKTEALKKSGLEAAADSLAYSSKIKNQQIISYFRKNFDFCPVFFIYDTSTSNLINGNKIVVLNDNAEPGDVLQPVTKKFFIGELNYLSPTTTGSEEFSSISDATKYGFIIYTSELQLPEPPFPYFIKGDDLSVNRTDAQLIWLMNMELHRFYQESLEMKNE